MGYLKFRSLEWTEAPEVFLIRMETKPLFEVLEDGTQVFDKMSQAARVFDVRGFFLGENATERFQALMGLLGDRTAGDLIHPVWGSFKTLLTRVELDENSGPGCVAYKAVFEETDADGNPVALPDLPVIVLPGNGGNQTE